MGSFTGVKQSHLTWYDTKKMKPNSYFQVYHRHKYAVKYRQPLWPWLLNSAEYWRLPCIERESISICQWTKAIRKYRAFIKNSKHLLVRSSRLALRVECRIRFQNTDYGISKTQTEMWSRGPICRHLLKWKWQLPMQPVTTNSSTCKWPWERMYYMNDNTYFSFKYDYHNIVQWNAGLIIHKSFFINLQYISQAVIQAPWPLNTLINI